MRKIALLLTGLLLLAGCGQQAAGSIASAAPEAEPQVWGTTALLESDGSEAEPSEREMQGSAAEESAVPTPTPTPTPLPDSLTETVQAGPTVIADGVGLTCIKLDGKAYVRADELEAVYPWLTLQPETAGNAALLTAYDGSQTEMPFIESDGLSTPVPPENGGVHFIGGQEEYWLPVRQTASDAGLWLVWDEEWGTVYLTLSPDTSLIQSGRRIPILMYHEVGDNTWGISDLFVSPENMRQQLQYLWDNGYEPIFFSDLTHLEDYDKPVLLTFDDGYIGNYTELYPLLQEYNMKATIFISTGLLGKENYMDQEQVREMSDSGLVSIQSHTVSHAVLGDLGYDDQQWELKQSLIDIARITRKVPYALAYPTGSYNDTTVELGRKYYCFGVKMNGGKWSTDGGRFTVTRSYVARTTDIGSYAALLQS